MRSVRLVLPLIACTIGHSGALALDAALPDYTKVPGISGTIKSVGSDSLNHEMELWAAGFRAKYPGVKFEIEGRGSATAPPALLAGTSQLGPMSRLMSGEEVSAFRQKYGYNPTGIAVAVDALAIYVNKENPLQCITIEQLDRMYSSTRKASGGRSIETWGDVGLTEEWALKPISLYGRNNISGTYEFFRRQVLYDGDFKDSVKEEAGSQAVVDAVSNDKFAVGYSGIGYMREGVRALPVSVYFGQKCYEASPEHTYAGKYPIARLLFIYLNKKPEEALNPVEAEFIKYVLSKEGQAQTEKGGYFPINADLRENEMKKLDISKPDK